MFAVRWRNEALAELAALWTSADSAARGRITVATDQIDRDLGHSPFDQSDSRHGGLRIRFSPPLGVIFQVEADGRTVSVLHIWRFRQQGSS